MPRKLSGHGREARGNDSEAISVGSLAFVERIKSAAPSVTRLRFFGEAHKVTIKEEENGRL
jgi:hypothetical protein